MISLERARERLKYIINHCKYLNIEHETIEAIDGNIITQQDK